MNTGHRVLNQKEFHYNILKSSQDQLQELKNGSFYLKNLR